MRTVANGHDYVDLGLSVNWATCNVGAMKPFNAGALYAWGETSTKSTYSEDNCLTYEKELSDISGASKYDVARLDWGGTWRTPTKYEMLELLEECEWIWTYIDNHKGGYIVTGPNGNRIFLPEIHPMMDSEGNQYRMGEYWTSTPLSGWASNTEAANLFFGPGGKGIHWTKRSRDCMVRPVTD